MKELCIRCGKPTIYHPNTPITLRRYFVEASRQLCEQCFYELYPVHELFSKIVVYWLMHFDNHCKTLNASVELYHEWSCRGHILNLGLKCLYQLPRQDLFPFHQTQEVYDVAKGISVLWLKILQQWRYISVVVIRYINTVPILLSSVINNSCQIIKTHKYF